MTENFDNDPQVRRVRAILKQAESAAKLGNQAEADTFTEKAVQLMAKYGVDQALLAATGEVKDEIINKRFLITSNFAMDKRVLLSRIVTALGARTVIFSNHRQGTYQGKDYVCHVFAFESDMKRIEFLFGLLCEQMIIGAAAARIPYGENKRSYRKSWMAGFSMAIYHRLERVEVQAVADAGVGTDLVLFDRRTAVEKAYNTAYPKLGKPIARKIGGSGMNDGYVAGQRVSMGDNQIGGSRTAMLR